MSGNLATEFAPPLDIVERYFIASLFMLALFFISLVIDPTVLTGAPVSFKLASVTHFITLGFISMVMIGALHQLTPVILEVRIFSYSLARLQFWVYLIGVAGLIGSFRFGDFKLAAVFVGILTIAVLLFAINIGISLFRVKRWKINGFFIASGIFYLVLSAIAANFLIALFNHNLGIEFKTLLLFHIAFAAIGWFLFIIIGAALELFPMFLLSRGYNTVPSKIAAGLLWAVIWIPIFAEIFGFETSFFAEIVLFVAAAILIVYQVLMIYKKRMRKKLDIPLSASRIAFLFFIAAIAAKAIGLSWQLAGFFFFVGFCGTLILGQLYKIFPFLVWFHRYGDLIGKEKVPLLADMLDTKIMRYQEISWYIAVGLVSVGLIISNGFFIIAGSAVALFSIAVFAVNFIKVHRHLRTG